MNNSSIWQLIQRFNHGRDPERLNLKYRAMQKDSFSFFRATAHLFYRDWPQASDLNDAPLAWVCGDLHLENFGTYKGDNRLCYFDINDFDEAVLAPCSWDIGRFLCSLLLATDKLALDEDSAIRLCKTFLRTYSAEIASGKVRWIERDTATGMIRDLLRSLKHRSRADLLKERTLKQHGKRRLRTNGKKALPVSNFHRQKVETLLQEFAAEQAGQGSFKVIDVARRIAGLSSLGLERYVILVKAFHSKKHYLLDLKHQPGSSLTPFLNVPQPIWGNEASRGAGLQNRGQAIAPAFLAVLADGQRSYVLKELMPQQDRLDLLQWRGKLSRLESVVTAMAQLTAWQHLRTGGWQGSATADQWQEFGSQSHWQAPLLEYAQHYSQKVRQDWLSFKEEIVYFTESAARAVR